MKVIFLDVDGVLNTSKTNSDILDIDSFRLEYLKAIIDETGAKIVLSSSWVKFFTKVNNKIIPRNEKGFLFYNLLNLYNIEFYDILGTGFNREEMIIDWVSKNEVDSFVIIDDEPNKFNKLLDRLIKTSIVEDNQMLTNMDDCFGLCYYHIEIAKNMLKNKVKVKK